MISANQPGSSWSGRSSSVNSAPISTLPAGRVPDAASAQVRVREPDPQQIHETVSLLQKVLSPKSQDLQFSVDKDSGRTVGKVMDTSTDKVLRRFPSGEILAMSKTIDSFQQGHLLKQRA